mmetsp:Transcript_14958/g.43149  ORF Transcript_14958/g.43149 Transcript_14958/m.43149 type:complete len:395 (+) Transcript_14958:746-1930(+)
MASSKACCWELTRAWLSRSSNNWTLRSSLPSALGDRKSTCCLKASWPAHKPASSTSKIRAISVCNSEMQPRSVGASTSAKTALQRFASASVCAILSCKSGSSPCKTSCKLDKRICDSLTSLRSVSMSSAKAAVSAGSTGCESLEISSFKLFTSDRISSGRNSSNMPARRMSSKRISSKTSACCAEIPLLVCPPTSLEAPVPTAAVSVLRWGARSVSTELRKSDSWNCRFIGEAGCEDVRPISFRNCCNSARSSSACCASRPPVLSRSGSSLSRFPAPTSFSSTSRRKSSSICRRSSSLDASRMSCSAWRCCARANSSQSCATRFWRSTSVCECSCTMGQSEGVSAVGLPLSARGEDCVAAHAVTTSSILPVGGADPSSGKGGGSSCSCNMDIEL